MEFVHANQGTEENYVKKNIVMNLRVDKLHLSS